MYKFFIRHDLVRNCVTIYDSSDIWISNVFLSKTNYIEAVSDCSNMAGSKVAIPCKFTLEKLKDLAINAGWASGLDTDVMEEAEECCEIIPVGFDPSKLFAKETKTYSDDSIFDAWMNR